VVAARYEDLRSAVLGGAAAGVRHGWGVLARAGMAAWIAAVRSIPVPGSRPSPARVGGQNGPVPAGQAGALVAALAGMVLAHRAPP
jgi:hypothetical protein